MNICASQEAMYRLDQYLAVFRVSSSSSFSSSCLKGALKPKLAIIQSRTNILRSTHKSFDGKRDPG